MQDIALDVIFILFIIMSIFCFSMCSYLFWDFVKQYKAYNEKRKSFDDWVSREDRINDCSK